MTSTPASLPSERRVLIVDDSPEDRAEIRRLLLGSSSHRYALAEVATGEQALAALADPSAPLPDVVILDFDLPDRNGHAMLRALGGGDGEIQFPVIVLTGAVGDEEGAAILRSGAHDFIGKEWLTPASLTRSLVSARERFLIQRELRETRRKLEVSEALARERVDELEAIYATAPVGLCYFDKDLRYLRINATLAEVNGVPASAHLGRTILEVLPLAVGGPHDALIRGVLATGEPIIGLETRTETTSQPGVLRDFVVSYIPFRSREGVVTGLNAVVFEVTALKQAEREIRHREERLLLALDVARMGFWEWDIQADRVHWSDALFSLLGQEPVLRERSVEEFFETVHPDDLARVRQTVEDTVERNAPHELEFRVLYPDGSVRWVASKAKLLHDADGRPHTLTGVDMDITARKEIEARREVLLTAEQAARAEAERLGRMKDEFLATLSHELRTPLNAILGWTGILRRRMDDEPTRRKALEVIERNAHLQAQLINDLLDMNRILSGKLHLTPLPTSLADVAQEAVETVRPMADVKGVQLEIALTPGSGVVYGDPDRLQQIAWNMLTNAIKFTGRGGAVRVAVAPGAEGFALSVSDTGEGIAPEFLPHVFERFRQADATIARRHGGLGLGLAIVRQIAELHGGTVRAASEGLGRGSTFTLTLPPLDDGPHLPAVAPRDEARALSYSPPALDAIEDLALVGIRVLVVDDQQDTREFVERLLAERGARVTTAASAEEALARIEAAPPDVLIADIGMPDVDGYELIRRLRQRSVARGGAVPAVALTAFARAEDRARAFAAGYEEHVPKPAEPAALFAVIARLARLHGTPASREPPPP